MSKYEENIKQELLECYWNAKKKKTNEKGIEVTSILHLSRELDETPHKATSSSLESLFLLKKKGCLQ